VDDFLVVVKKVLQDRLTQFDLGNTVLFTADGTALCPMLADTQPDFPADNYDSPLLVSIGPQLANVDYAKAGMP
jgi:hypothetical protein